MEANDGCLLTSSPGFISAAFLPLFAAIGALITFSRTETISALNDMYNTLKVHSICYCSHANQLASHFVYLLRMRITRAIVCCLCGEANVANCGQAELAGLEVWMPSLCQLHTSPCCLWRETFCVLIAHFPQPSAARCCFIIEKPCSNGLRGPRCG